MSPLGSPAVLGLEHVLQARPFVVERRPVIEEVAQALVTLGALNGAEVRRIVARSSILSSRTTGAYQSVSRASSQGEVDVGHRFI
jgi:hypothetical protein